MSATINTAAELDALQEVVSIAAHAALVRDAVHRDWIVWEDDGGDLWATSYHTEDDDTPINARILVAAEDLRFPLTVLYRPDQPEGVAEPLVSANSRSVALDPVAATPSGLPTVEQVAQAIEDYIERSTIPAGNLFQEPIGVTPTQLARAVLALFEAAVPSIKAEALRDVAETAEDCLSESEHQQWDYDWIVYLRETADRIEADRG